MLLASRNDRAAIAVELAAKLFQAQPPVDPEIVVQVRLLVADLEFERQGLAPALAALGDAGVCTLRRQALRARHAAPATPASPAAWRQQLESGRNRGGARARGRGRAARAIRAGPAADREGARRRLRLSSDLLLPQGDRPRAHRPVRRVGGDLRSADRQRARSRPGPQLPGVHVDRSRRRDREGSGARAPGAADRLRTTAPTSIRWAGASTGSEGSPRRARCSNAPSGCCPATPRCSSIWATRCSPWALGTAPVTPTAARWPWLRKTPSAWRPSWPVWSGTRSLSSGGPLALLLLGRDNAGLRDCRRASVRRPLPTPWQRRSAPEDSGQWLFRAELSGEEGSGSLQLLLRRYAAGVSCSRLRTPWARRAGRFAATGTLAVWLDPQGRRFCRLDARLPLRATQWVSKIRLADFPGLLTGEWPSGECRRSGRPRVDRGGRTRGPGGPEDHRRAGRGRLGLLDPLGGGRPRRLVQAARSRVAAFGAAPLGPVPLAGDRAERPASDSPARRKPPSFSCPASSWRAPGRSPAPEMRFLSFAKVNLHLEVLRRREDGFHELRTIFQTIDLADEIELVPAAEPASRRSSSKSKAPICRPTSRTSPGAPRTASSARWGRPGEGVRLRLVKRIPIGGGLGGGQRQRRHRPARAVRAPAGAIPGRWRSRRSAAGLGSDVPFFLHGGTALGTGRGERDRAAARSGGAAARALARGAAGRRRHERRSSRRTASRRLRRGATRWEGRPARARGAERAARSRLCPRPGGALLGWNDLEPTCLALYPAVRDVYNRLSESGARLFACPAAARRSSLCSRIERPERRPGLVSPARRSGCPSRRSSRTEWRRRSGLDALSGGS